MTTRWREVTTKAVELLAPLEDEHPAIQHLRLNAETRPECGILWGLVREERERMNERKERAA